MTQASLNHIASEDLFVRAQACMERGDLASAEKLLLELIKEGGEDFASARTVSARTALAEVYETLGRHRLADEALAPYAGDELETYAPHERALIFLAKGSRAYWQKDFPRSVALLKHAAEVLETTNDAINVARAHHYLGRSYWALGDQQIAHEHYELAIWQGRRLSLPASTTLTRSADASATVSPDLIATSFAMRDVMTRIERLKESDATVLILGDSGTGKEVIARAMHDGSRRSDKKFLPFNCSAAPRELVESQLFGHKRGSFTGAVKDHLGIIRAAEGGTLFLDEIGDLAAEVQPKLLRFLQDSEIMPLGEGPRKVQVRVLAATNHNLEQDVREGRFREDLYYRLNTFVIKLPQLRERPEDIPLLATYYFDEMCSRHQRQLAGITPEAMNYLLRYDWPGNVRQLRNEIERMVVFAEDDQAIGIESLSSDILRDAYTVSPVRFDLDFTRPVDFKELMLDIERRLLSEALAQHAGNVTRTAELLRLRRQTLDYKLRKFNLVHSNAEADETED
jgi:transcriptional regulator with PAS, ATPase and Fis domain